MPPAPATIFEPCKTVLGFLPYWTSSANVQWDTLTHLACFGAEFDGTGAITNRRGWPWTSTTTTARSNNIEVLLTLIIFDDVAIDALMDSPAATTRFYDNVASLIRNTADGIMIDFEGTNSTAWAQRMPTFVTNLRAALNSRLAPARPTIWIATPAVNWSGGWNFASLANASDGLFIMGYDFYGSWSSTSGPSAPLTGGSFNITNTVVTQYGQARAAAASKLVLGVPYYGNQWRTNTSGAYSTAAAFIGSVVYSSAATQSVTYGRLFDAASQTPWYRWPAAGTQWNQTWYDDAQSLRAKYDLAQTYSLGGVGMWALGYDGSRTELAEVLRDEFIRGCPCDADFNRDRSADFFDYLDFVAAWNGNRPNGDFNRDGSIDFFDYLDFVAAFDRGCPF